MIDPQKLRFRKGDCLAIAAVVFLAFFVLLCFLPGGETGGCAEVYLHGKLIKTLALTEDQVFTVRDTYTNEITVSGGKVSVTFSDCPGGDCMHSGSIQSTGRSLVCLPNGLEIRIVNTQDDVDFVVG